MSDETANFATIVSLSFAFCFLLDGAFSLFLMRYYKGPPPIQDKEAELVFRQVLQECFGKQHQDKAESEAPARIRRKPPSWLRVKPMARGRSTKRADVNRSVRKL